MKIIKSIDKGVMYFLILLTSIMLIVGTLQVFFRFIVKASLSWSEELMRYLHVWITMLGIVLAKNQNALATITVLEKKIKPNSKRYLAYTIGFIETVIFVVLTIYGFKIFISNMGQVSPALGVKMGLIYSVIPISGILGLLSCLNSFVDLKNGR